MEHFLEEVKKRIGKPYNDLDFLLECFSKVLLENNEPEPASRVPWISVTARIYRGKCQKAVAPLFHQFSVAQSG